MILLDGHSLTPKRKVPLESLRIQLKERESSATMVPADMTGIGVNSWLQDDTEPGKGVVWRVKSINTAYATDTPTVTMEHVVASLKDRILFGEVTPATITGNKNATTCTAKQAVQYILGKSPDWTLGTFDYNVTNPYKFNGDSLFDALETVSDSLEDAWWSYDLSVYPFKLNIKRAGSSVGSEMRAGRNIRTITRTVDRGGMYTRFYPIGENDKHISGDFVSKNESAYGLVAHVETDTTISTEAELRRWANERLAKHAEPTVTTEIEGLELAAATGEALDRLVLGRQCRVPLPEYGTTITERITELNYPDKVGQPEMVKVTLSNSRNDVTKIIADNMKQAARGGGGRGSAKRQKQDLAWFEDTNDHVAMCAIGIIGVDAQGKPNWTRMAQLVVDGTGIHSAVTDLQGDVKQHETRFDQDERKIGMVVGSYDSGGNYIKAGEICLAINNDGSSDATIEATKIHLLGETIAQTVSADFIQSRVNLMNALRVKQLTVANSLYFESGGSTITGSLAADIFTGLRVADAGNNKYKLQALRVGAQSWTDLPNSTFSRAVASWDQSWSSGTFTVTAQPQNQNCTTTIEAGTSSWDGRTVTIYINARNSNSPSQAVPTGKSVQATYTQPKNGITLTRQKQNSEPSADGTLSKITSNGWYLLTVTAGGTEKTWKVQVDV